MRLLKLGLSSMIATERPLQWALDAGHEVVMLTPEPWRSGIRPRPGLKVITFSELDKSPGQVRHLPVVERQLEQLVGQIIDQFQIDLIHQYFHQSRLYSLTQRKDRPMVVSAWGFLNALAFPDERQDFVNDLAQRLTEEISIEGLVVESPCLAEAARSHFPSIERVAMLPVGVDTGHFHGGWEKEAWLARLRYGIPDNAFVFLSARGWARFYQHQLVLEAFKRALPMCQGPTYLAFLGMGRGGRDLILKYKQEMEEQVEALGLSDHVIWLQRAAHDDMPTIYNLADVVINYPRHDAFPATLQEALACERPVISADLPTYRDTPLHRHLSLVPQGDLEALAAAMSAATYEPPTERRERMAAARQTMKEHYEERKMAARLMALYDALLADRGSG